ncbi:MAG: T9SS type A sorting domain-containing protein [Chitinophagales bacterium]
MRKTAILCFIPFINIMIIFSQAPSVEWQNTIGGLEQDQLNSIHQTTDGGYILGGYSASDISGDKSDPLVPGVLFNTDYWIIKLDSAGAIQWQNDIGGSDFDYLETIQETADGGYIVGGNSSSGISGDKTEACVGNPDYWILKLDATGAIVWQNTIGGNFIDHLSSITPTPDGGYFVAGYSGSGISGDKTEGVSGVYDYWILKLNSTGAIIWQNTIGGTGDDFLYHAERISSGGYILAGKSNSGISGDKTEANLGANDYWIIKVSNAGNIIWQKTAGGADEDRAWTVEETNSGGFIIGGESYSGTTGNKTEANIGFGDFWLVELSAAGIMVGQNTIGSYGNESLHDIAIDGDDGFFLAGNSDGGISGDKTEANIGSYDYWVMRLNSSGGIIWQNTIGGNDLEYVNAFEKTADAGYILGTYSMSGISGDKSEPNIGSFDYWIIKLSGECVPVAEICNGYDDDCNTYVDDGVIETISISAGGATTFCQGGNVLLSAIYSGTSVQWKKNGVNIPGAIASTYLANKSGNYTAVTTSPCGTVTSLTIIVTVNNNPSASITAGGATTFCAGGSVTLTEAAVAGSTYQWYKGASAIAGATSTNYIATTAGNYKCRVTKTASGCFKNSNAITVTVPCRESQNHDLLDLEDSQDFVIYPNPNNGTFTINALWPRCALCDNNASILEIYNSLGQVIHSQIIDSSDGIINKTISISEGSCGDNLPAGIYFIKLSAGDLHYQQKLIIQ